MPGPVSWTSNSNSSILPGGGESPRSLAIICELLLSSALISSAVLMFLGCVDAKEASEPWARLRELRPL